MGPRKKSRGAEDEKAGGAGHSSSHKGPSPNKERLASEKEGEKVSKSKKSKKRDRSRRRRSSPERSVKAPASPQPARSPRSFIPVKEEGESEGDGPSAPPGRWSLTEAPFSWSTLITFKGVPQGVQGHLNRRDRPQLGSLGLEEVSRESQRALCGVRDLRISISSASVTKERDKGSPGRNA